MRPGLEDGSDAEAMGARERSEGAAKARWGWQDRDEGRRGRDGKIIPLRCGSLRPYQPLSYMRDPVKVHALVIPIDKSPVGLSFSRRKRALYRASPSEAHPRGAPERPKTVRHRSRLNERSPGVAGRRRQLSAALQPCQRRPFAPAVSLVRRPMDAGTRWSRPDACQRLTTCLPCATPRRPGPCRACQSERVCA